MRAMFRVRNSAFQPYAGVMEPTLEELEELLRRAQPLPRIEFVRELEEFLVRSLETSGCFRAERGCARDALIRYH
jgi:hypothetical protein